jgi:hypothetical protein
MESVFTKGTKIVQGAAAGAQNIFQGNPRKMVSEKPEPADAPDKSAWLKKDFSVGK